MMFDKGKLQCCNESLPVVGGSAIGDGLTQHVVVFSETLATVSV